ncbi:MAG: hypothetical protein A2651_01820 [Candidatus Yanofskybacteria bacterium RIFCSPHIGHO2_01_FULL_42_12]|uniref:Uncharacterized protein n=1 Tax=Candidatus Yanofskybacteria bacterium RIFCSPLOWO2_01_FULL_42_49 TaxID=1802694 RepID=A0A1F8GAR1_9BACT|nr:MAG: hypothetical protein A2651_01820 [Candidatus Yanofskybacteria bacterium RIFCSPHIGHO2_01_FULL_42_12]OGN22472.1 MAG: hypothetical protein A2918_01780 [Candidatus Yanofskybacteria bacterium RIFCSPLOWO2_01_FULL_42_49]
MKPISILYLKSVVLTVTVASLFFTGFNAKAQHSNGSIDTVLYGSNGNLEAFVCNSLLSMGLGCGYTRTADRPSPAIESGVEPLSQKTKGDISSTENNIGSGTVNIGTGATSQLTASMANITIKRSVSSDKIILLRVPSTTGFSEPTIGLGTDESIFEIIKGQRHFIPTVDIFFDYGFSLDAVQKATKQEVSKFPRIKLVRVKNDKTNYYITEGRMIRPFLNKKVFDSYGNREEDIVIISEKEFSFYPRNQFVFAEGLFGLSGVQAIDIFQLTGDGQKRYLVPQVARKMRISSEQVAPINKTELDSYDYGNPILF